ncbi:TetR/AcrR family transcriptional regulator [Novosphingobium sp. AAP93]|uniref:TetR/AcrR family transcriptional regulator n=1 Tax=Novosphingobium sp. AAP93 TaxID=1523427 RepID=UPI0006CD6973|nr:TetR/AcrR family transcriptional regulator [Novosphingobium sp. AAP93]KPF86640.1 TetR family transcriptional regulator [Novosphingobium sp. AAP93]
MKNRMLDAMLPSGQGKEPARWQQQKSARTRLRLIEAAIDCLVEGGYSRLTTQAVAERTKASRGSIHHHFPTRVDLVAAVVEHVFYERMRLFLDDYLAAIAGGSEADVVTVAAAAHWRSVQTRQYAAYLELAVAARTDRELDAFFAPAVRRYDEVWTGEMIESFPQWRDRWERMKLASDFVNVLHMGLLLQQPVFGDARIQRVQTLADGVLRQIYADKVDA